MPEADLGVQPLPDTSSRWSKGPSAPGLVSWSYNDARCSANAAPPGLEARRVWDRAILPHPPSPAPSRPLPAPAGRLCLQTAGPQPRPWTQCGHRLPAAPHRFPPPLTEVTRLQEAVGAARCRRSPSPTPPTCSPPAWPGLLLACTPPPPPPALPRVTPGLSSDFKTTVASWCPELSPALFMMCCLSATDLACSIPVIIILYLQFHSTMRARLSHWTLSS